MALNDDVLTNEEDESSAEVATGIDLETLEISDFVDESKLSAAEEISTVMAASCTTCECCCSCSI